MGQARQEWVQQRKRARREMPSADGDIVVPDDKGGYRRRAATFADWIMKTFGEAALKGGVLDVAVANAFTSVNYI